MTKAMRFSSFLLLAISLFLIGCKKDEPKNSSSENGKEYLLVIENGAQTIGPDDQLTYTAYLVDVNGKEVQASGITWTSSNKDCATISSGGAVTVVNNGTATITAKVTLNGVTYEATVPLSIRIPSLFAVVPSAVIMQVGDKQELTTVLMGTSTLSSVKYSSNSDVATVDASGVITGAKVGVAVITVTGNSDQGELVVNVPVSVIGIPDVILPVTKIKVNPNSKLIFKNDQIQLSATAYNSNNEVVSGTNFTWISEDPNIATVEANGSVTGKAVGIVNISALAKGIKGTAQIEVLPDTVVMITPFFAEIGKGKSKQFKAELVNNKTGALLNSSPSDFSWQMFETGIAVFDPGTVNSTGLVTVKDQALEGTMGHVFATYKNGNPDELTGMAAFMVGSNLFGGGGDCGDGNASVDKITVDNPVSTLAFGSEYQLNVTAADANNNAISGDAKLVYSSTNTAVLTVDANGKITPTGLGTAKIKICSGDYANTEIEITVTF